MTIAIMAMGQFAKMLNYPFKIVGLIPMLTEMAQPAVAPVAHSKFPERKFSSYFYCLAEYFLSSH